MTLRVRRLARSLGDALLADYLPEDGALAVHTDGRARWLSVHGRSEARATEDRYALGPDGATMVDRTVFHLGPDRFVEAERYTTRDGPNLHAAPIVLPARMALGAGVTVGAARVTLVHRGPVRLSRGEAAWEADAVGLVGEEGGVAQVQWMARGVGAVALGPLGRAPTRWLLAFSGGAPWPERVPGAVAALPRAPLRDGPAEAPRARLL